MNLDPRTMTPQDFDEAQARAMLLGGRYDWRSQSCFIVVDMLGIVAIDRDVETGEVISNGERLRRANAIHGMSYGLTYADMLRWRRDQAQGINHVPIPDPSR